MRPSTSVVLPTGPIGPPPCLQSGAIGGPADPCSYKLHHLTPEEVTISKGGRVTFQIHGGGHGFAIYEVSKDTTRDELGQFLCKVADPEEIADIRRCMPATCWRPTRTRRIGSRTAMVM